MPRESDICVPPWFHCFSVTTDIVSSGCSYTAFANNNFVVRLRPSRVRKHVRNDGLLSSHLCFLLLC